MSKVLVINSPLFHDQSDKNREDYLPPLGLGVVASALDSHHHVDFVDMIAENYSVSMIIEKIKQDKPDIVCINVFTTNYSIVKCIVEGDSSAHRWIIGGLSTRAIYQEIFKWSSNNQIDVVCGDGEMIILDIVNDSVTDSPTYSENNRRYYNISSSSQYYVRDLDMEVLNRSYFTNEPYLNVDNELEASVYSSRGCPHNCAFCGAARSRNKDTGIRRKSHIKLVNEIERLLQRNGNISCIRVLDDLFLSDKTSMVNAVNIFNRFNLKWRAMCHVKSLANIEIEVLKELKNSGCKELFIGIESGSERILRKLHKTDNKELIMSSLESLFAVGIKVKGYFVCGIPSELEEDLALSLEFATKLKQIAYSRGSQFRVTCFQFRPYCGTELCDDIIATGIASKQSILDGTKESIGSISKSSFGFDSGNYSEVSDSVLADYIERMNRL